MWLRYEWLRMFRSSTAWAGALFLLLTPLFCLLGKSLVVVFMAVNFSWVSAQCLLLGSPLFALSGAGGGAFGRGGDWRYLFSRSAAPVTRAFLRIGAVGGVGLGILLAVGGVGAKYGLVGPSETTRIESWWEVDAATADAASGGLPVVMVPPTPFSRTPSKAWVTPWQNAISLGMYFLLFLLAVGVQVALAPRMSKRRVRLLGFAGIIFVGLLPSAGLWLGLVIFPSHGGSVPFFTHGWMLMHLSARWVFALLIVSNAGVLEIVRRVWRRPVLVWDVPLGRAKGAREPMPQPR